MSSNRRHGIRWAFNKWMSSRYFYSILATGLASLSPMILTLVLARGENLEKIGLFGAMYAIFLLIQQLVRDLFVTPFIAHRPSVDEQKRKAAIVSLAGVLCALVLVPIGFLLHSPHVGILGLCIHGMLLGSYCRYLDLTLGTGRAALFQELPVFIIVAVASALSLMFGINPFAVVVTWVVAYSLIGYVASKLKGIRLKPGWWLTNEEKRTGLAFGLQGLLGSGSAHILTLILTSISTSIVGIFRVSSTLFGPANLISSAFQPVLIGSLSDGRGKRSPTGGANVDWKKAKLAAVAVPLLVMIILILLFSVGYYWGENLFPVIWNEAFPIVIIMFFDIFIVCIGLVPQTVHLISWSTRRALTISILGMSTRVPSVIIGAVFYGAQGAAFGYLVATILTTTLWLFSSISLMNQNTDNPTS